MFSAVIKDLRLRRGLTQKELAQELYLSPSAISQYENGVSRPSRETLDSLAQYFGVSVSFLLGASVNAEVEVLLSEEFCQGVSMSDILKKCTEIPPEDRPAFLHMLEGLTYSCISMIAAKIEKVCR